MPVDVDDGFLDNSKEGQLHFAIQPLEARGSLHVDPKTGALAEASREQADRRYKAELAEQRRMKPVRERRISPIHCLERANVSDSKRLCSPFEIILFTWLIFMLIPVSNWAVLSCRSRASFGAPCPPYEEPPG